MRLNLAPDGLREKFRKVPELSCFEFARILFYFW